MALARQPALAASRASLAAAEENSRGLNNLHVPTIIARELPIRRKQACLGVTIAAAGLDQAERDTVYAVTRNYYSVIFAREQLKVAQQVVDNLKAILDAAQGQVKAGSKDVTTNSVDKTTVYLDVAKTRLGEAARGDARARAALKEAIGLGPDSPLELAPGKLQRMKTTATQEDIVSLALARRGELVQASNLAQVTCLEIDAQETSCRPTFHTFASGSDIHSRTVPEGTSNSEYRPGAVAPEMPVNLVGSRKARVARARAFSARADAVADKTRNLVALEAEDAYLKWQETAERIPLLKEASEKGTKLADDTRNDFLGGQKVSVEEVLTNQVLGSQIKAQYNEALYHQILALAALERVTAGGFSAGLQALPTQLPAVEK
jgi:outer membrane protein TolC